MKTDRLTLLISPADKAAINGRAESLGISVSELVRNAALAYDPDEEEAKAQLELLLPEFHDTLDRIVTTLDRMLENNDKHRLEMEHLRSPEYHEQLQREVWADPRIDWNWVRSLRDGALHQKAAA